MFRKFGAQSAKRGLGQPVFCPQHQTHFGHFLTAIFTQFCNDMSIHVPQDISEGILKILVCSHLPSQNWRGHQVPY